VFAFSHDEVERFDMAAIQRGMARGEGIIEADIDNTWALLTDWGNMDWWGNDLDQGAMTAARTYLEGEKGQVPRTKVIERESGDEAGVSHVNREVLIHEDSETHRLYYTCSNGLLLGVNNYLASWTLDALEGARCRMTVTAQFDVVEPGKLEEARNTFEAVYELIFKGVGSYLAKRGGTYTQAG
jgi:hypothetical protein